MPLFLRDGHPQIRFLLDSSSIPEKTHCLRNTCGRSFGKTLEELDRPNQERRLHTRLLRVVGISHQHNAVINHNRGIPSHDTTTPNTSSSTLNVNITHIDWYMPQHHIPPDSKIAHGCVPASHWARKIGYTTNNTCQEGCCVVSPLHGALSASIRYPYTKQQ